MVDQATSVLSRSRFVNRFHRCPEPLVNEATGEIAPFLIELLETHRFDFYIYPNDELGFKVRDSGLSTKKKERVLPVQDSSHFGLIGEKVALSQVCQRLGVRTPGFQIANDSGELENIVEATSRDSLVKANLGAGGLRVIDSSNIRKVVNDSWFPVVVQEFVQGSLVGVEALFIQGQLASWNYSIVDDIEKPFGVSTIRTFAPPESLDFVEALADIGRVSKLHAFANASFIKSESDNLHYLFELDLRPNAWHQFGPQLGADWRTRLLEGGTADPPKHSGAPSQIEKVGLYPRALILAIKTRDFANLASLLKANSGKWKYRNHADNVVNRFERLQVARSIAYQLWSGLSPRVRRRLGDLRVVRQAIWYLREGRLRSQGPR